jgi:hypothetical protein
MPDYSRADDYRRKAAAARRMADAVKDHVSLKDSFLAAEKAWLELAEQAEYLDRRHRPEGD